MALYFMEDCIHLKACRRYQKRIKKAGYEVARGCNNKCTCYQDGKKGLFYLKGKKVPLNLGEAIRYVYPQKENRAAVNRQKKYKDNSYRNYKDAVGTGAAEELVDEADVAAELSELEE